jgi:hypothetical protein
MSMGSGRLVDSYSILCLFHGDRSIFWGGAMHAAGVNPQTLALCSTGSCRFCVHSTASIGTGRFVGREWISHDPTNHGDRSIRVSTVPAEFYGGQVHRSILSTGSGRFVRPSSTGIGTSMGTGRFFWDGANGCGWHEPTNQRRTGTAQFCIVGVFYGDRSIRFVRWANQKPDVKHETRSAVQTRATCWSQCEPFSLPSS